MINDFDDNNGFAHELSEEKSLLQHQRQELRPRRSLCVLVHWGVTATLFITTVISLLALTQDAPVAGARDGGYQPFVPKSKCRLCHYPRDVLTAVKTFYKIPKCSTMATISMSPCLPIPSRTSPSWNKDWPRLVCFTCVRMKKAV